MEQFPTSPNQVRVNSPTDLTGGSPVRVLSPRSNGSPTLGIATMFGNSPSSPRVISPIASPRGGSPQMVGSPRRGLTPIASPREMIMSPRDGLTPVSPTAMSPRGEAPIGSPTTAMSPLLPTVNNVIQSPPRVVSPQTVQSPPRLPAIGMRTGQGTGNTLPTVGTAMVSPTLPVITSPPRSTLGQGTTIPTLQQAASPRLPTIGNTATTPKLPTIQSPTRLPTISGTRLPTIGSTTTPKLPTIGGTTGLPTIQSPARLPTIGSTTTPKLPTIQSPARLPTIGGTTGQTNTGTLPRLPTVQPTTTQTQVTPTGGTITTGTPKLPSVNLSQLQNRLATVQPQQSTGQTRLPTLGQTGFGGTATQSTQNQQPLQTWTTPQFNLPPRGGMQLQAPRQPPQMALPMQTDLGALNQVRSGLTQAQEINPQAAFQQRQQAIPQQRPRLTPFGQPGMSIPRSGAPMGMNQTNPIRTVLKPIGQLGTQPVRSPMNQQPIQPARSPLRNFQPIQPVRSPMNQQPARSPLRNFQPIQPVRSPMGQTRQTLQPMGQTQPVRSPMRNFQPMGQMQRPTVQPISPVVGLPQATGSRTPGLGLRTAQLPTTRSVNPPVVTPGMVRTINLPQFNTTMANVPLGRPRSTMMPGLGLPQQGLTVAYTPQQQAVQLASGIDINRINPERARQGDNSYTHEELKQIARQLGLRVTGSKRDLATRIRETLERSGQQ